MRSDQVLSGIPVIKVRPTKLGSLDNELYLVYWLSLRKQGRKMRPGSRYDQKVWEREAEVEAEPARLLLERETIIGSYFNSESQYPVSGLYHRVINSLCMYVHT